MLFLFKHSWNHISAIINDVSSLNGSLGSSILWLQYLIKNKSIKNIEALFTNVIIIVVTLLAKSCAFSLLKLYFLRIIIGLFKLGVRLYFVWDFNKANLDTPPLFKYEICNFNKLTFCFDFLMWRIYKKNCYNIVLLWFLCDNFAFINFF